MKGKRWPIFSLKWSHILRGFQHSKNRSSLSRVLTNKNLPVVGSETQEPMVRKKAVSKAKTANHGINWYWEGGTKPKEAPVYNDPWMCSSLGQIMGETEILHGHIFIVDIHCLCETYYELPVPSIPFSVECVIVARAVVAPIVDWVEAVNTKNKRVSVGWSSNIFSKFPAMYREIWSRFTVPY